VIVTGWENPTCELQVGALELRAVADALDLEVLLEALRDTLDHVRDERPRQAVQRAVLAALGRRVTVTAPSSCAICIRAGTRCSSDRAAR
jgi:hypothetical protein